MKRFNKKYNVLITGLLTLIFFSLAIFWGRHLCQLVLTAGLFAGSGFQNRMDVTVTKFIPEFDERLKGFPIKETLDEGVFFNQSLNYLYDSYFRNFTKYNVCMDDLIALDMEMNKSVYYDRKTGQLVLAQLERNVSDRTVHWNSKLLAFAGPQGVSSSDNSSLGRFGEITCISRFNSTHEVFFFDQNTRRYCFVDFTHKTVKQSSVFTKADLYGDPLMRFPRSFGVHIEWKEYSELPKELQGRVTVSSSEKDNIFVLDRSGVIGCFDLNTMNFVGNQVGNIGYALNTLFAYSFVPYFMDNKYMGVVVITLNRTLQWMNLEVFDSKGILIKDEHHNLNPWVWEGGFTVSMIKWFLENLHPPILEVATYFTAEKFSALDGQKNIFLLSESLLGRLGREKYDQSLWERIFTPFIVILPSIILVCFLSFQVNREAKFSGLPLKSCRLWKYGTLLFGLPAYITWRITRPKEVMVTCKNCGKLRRVEFERCQHCNSPWQVPEITPPLWRVRDEVAEEAVS